MFITRLVLLFVISVIFSNSIEYKLIENDIKIIGNHFILNNSNAIVNNDKLIFDIYRLEFIADDAEQIKFKIKNINWVNANYKINSIELDSLISISESFRYKSCPMIYFDIFPYKVDKNNNLFYIQSLDIDFYIDDIVIDNFCRSDNSIINNSFLTLSPYHSIQERNIDYLIITNDILVPAAESIQSIHDDLNIEILDINDIATLYENENLELEYIIREYLLSRINTEPDLNYLLLLGDETIIPPIYSGSSPSDDFYTSPNNLGGNPQLSTGRIPVNNIQDANNFISKLDNYIQNLYNPSDSDYYWRMKIDLISDDENNPNPNKYPELSHTENSHLLYQEIKQNLVVNTLYGIDYVPIQNFDGLLHPDFTEDLIASINAGVSLINYIGHGNHHTLADEKILRMDRDLNLINTENYKLPIWVVGTCSFGQYDGTDSMSEALLLKENGGIAIISTTRGIGETSNINYLTKFFNQINNYIENLNNNNRLGDLIREAKNNSSSEFLFHLFGDPALPLPFPKLSTNSLESYPSELFIGNESNINIGFNNGYINVLDKEQSITRVYGEDTIDYNITGSSIYKGSFYEDVCFTTGIDASSCNECASIYTYIENDNYNFIQNIFNLNITQDDEGITDTLDINGPVVAFNTSDYRKLSQNDFIFLDDFIIVEAEDESGINLMNGLGHSIRYWFNNEQDYNLIDIDSFQYTTNCEALSKGEFIIPISNLNLGLNTLFVEIWDNFNNRTISSITLNVDNLSFKAYDIYNFPNPFMEKTSFTFKTSIYPTDATISIFDLSGKKIKKLNKICHNTFCSINWDGTDFSNKKVKNGTYIYSLSIVNGNKSFKSLNKITRLK